MKLEHAIDISASRDLVWAVTVDIERWPEWTPTMQSVKRLDDGPFRMGSQARIQQPGLPTAVWRVSAFMRGECFTWETRVRGIRMIATHQLAEIDGGTRNLLRLEMSGLMSILLRPLLQPSARRALRKENEGLKQRCEALALAEPAPNA